MSDYGELIAESFDLPRRKASELIIGNQDKSPDEAARAIQLSEVTGVPAPVIAGDVESFDRRTRSNLNAELVRNNAFISDFISSQPLAAQLSHDDLGPLDAVSGAADKLKSRSVLEAAWEGFKFGFGDQLVGSWAHDPKYPVASATYGVLGSVVEVPMRALSALTQGFAEGVGQRFTNITGNPYYAQQSRTVGQAVQDPGLAMSIGIPSPFFLKPAEAFAEMHKLRKDIAGLEPYIRAEKEPPFGVNKGADRLIKEQSTADLKALNEALKEAVGSKTRERAPEMFAGFIRQHIGDQKIGIEADAVRALYGDKVPQLDDGKLGWVPNIQDQLWKAEMYGGDILVPTADWLAKVEPELAKELNDFIRVRPNGVTKFETKVAAEAEELATKKIEETEPAGFTPSEMRQLLDEERESLINMWYETREPLPPTAGEMAKLSRSGFEKELNTVGILRAKTEEEARRILQDNRLAGNEVKATKPEPAIEGEVYKPTDPVVAVRASARIDKTIEQILFDTGDDLVKVEELDFGGGTTAKIQTEHLQPAQRKIIDAVDEVIKRIAPKQLETLPVRGDIETATNTALGVHITYNNRTPLMLYSLDAPDPIQIARHEALHHLRQQGFFTDAEWSTLMAAAINEGWLEKYDIQGRYAKDLESTAKIEEAVAHAYADWAKDPKAGKSQAAGIFQKIKEFLDEVKDAISRVLGRDPTWQELFDLADQGVIGSREGNKPRLEGGYRAAVKTPDTLIPMEDRDIFARAQAIGMTEEQYRRYMRLIEKRRAEDEAKANARVLENERRKQTAQWKDRAKEVRGEVVEDLQRVPDLAADAYLREGTFYGRRVEDTIHKLGTDYLTKEEIDALPKRATAVKGLSPDDVAGLFGFASGRDLIESVTRLESNRRNAGMGPEPYRRRLIEIETERRMEAEFGKLDENIIEAAKEQVLSETQLDLLHEETVFLAEKAGAQLPIARADLEKSIRDQVGTSLLSDVSSDRLLAAAGKAGRLVEDALLKGDAAEAFRQRQRQYIAVAASKEALRVEKERAQFEKQVKRFSKREVPNVSQEYTNYIQALLAQAGIAVRRSPEDIAGGIQFSGTGSLAEFVARNRDDGWEPVVSDKLQTEGTKPIDSQTVEDFRELKDAIDSLAHIGREVEKIEIAGTKADWAEFRGRVRENLQQLPERSRQSQGRWLYEIDASLTRMEEIVKDLDLRQELGPLYQAVIEPMMKSKAKEFDLLTGLSKHFAETRGEFGKEWRRSLRETIPQDILYDPYTMSKLDMTRENLINLMLNWGNASNRQKVASGYASLYMGRKAAKDEVRGFEVMLEQLINQHAREEDWAFVRRMWEPFKGWQKEMDTVSRNMSGVAPKWLEIDKVQTRFGEIDGGYWPVKYDRLGSDISVIEERRPPDAALFQNDYFRAATSKGYLKERTGYIDFVDLHTSIEQAAGTMQQTIHDIAFRDALVQAGRVFYDKGIRADIRKHYGVEYEAQLIPWLKRIANSYPGNNPDVRGYAGFMRRIRINLVGHALPLNLKVIGSPDIGVPNPKVWAAFEANRSENVALAMEKSDEIRHLVYNMDRDFREQLERTVTRQGLDSFQKKAVEWGFIPITKVSQEFRMATWVDQYHKALARGRSDAEAASIADGYVRERHGAASVVDLPAVMQDNEWMKALTMFYGYFNTMYNWQRQLPGQARRGEAKNFAVTALGSIGVGAAFGALLFNNRKEDESWWKIMAKALTLQPLSTVPIIREAASYFAEGFPQRTPTESLINAFGSIYSDLKRKAKGESAKNPIKNTANVIGLTTGLPMAQVGRTGEFLWDVRNKEQRPRNMMEWIRGIIHGEARLK